MAMDVLIEVRVCLKCGDQSKNYYITQATIEMVQLASQCLVDNLGKTTSGR
jgi:hypothetical protein